MVDYGYRLFVVSLHDGRRRDEQPFDAAVAGGDSADPIDFRDHLLASVQAALGSAIVDDADNEDGDDGLAERRVSCTRFQDGAARVRNTVRLHFDFGPVHLEGLAVDPQGVRQDFALAGSAINFPYRAALITADGLPRAILAVEVRGRTCPVSSVIRAVRTVTGGWRLRTHANVADRGAWDRFIGQANIDRVELTEWTYDNDGAARQQRAALWLKVDQEAQAPIDRLRDWARRRLEGETLDSAAEAQAISDEFVGVDIDIDFNDVAVHAQSGGQSRTLRPGSDYRRFTYELGIAAVSDQVFFNQAEQTATALLESVQAV